MVISINCPCGNTNPKHTLEYDGMLGYEAVVCTVCGRYSDFDLEGKERQNEPDDWSKKFIKIYKKSETK
jgi:hypothetical protein